jgi:hypothetical protein
LCSLVPPPKNSGKKFFLFIGHEVLFFKRLASTLEETMSVARPHLGKPESLLIGASTLRKSSPAVDGATNSLVLRRRGLKHM